MAPPNQADDLDSTATNNRDVDEVDTRRNSHADDRAGNIILTGFMGTGKSTVGRLLARQLRLEFVDTDAEIESRHGPIPAIFADHGERRFREIERRLAAELGQRSGLVIATGGAMMLDPANIASLGGKGRIFCLVAAPEEILARVHADQSPIERPLLAVDDPRTRIEELLAERSAGYLQFSQIPTSKRSPDEVADAILATLTDW
ncbi:MAG: shikimate kinase [Acidimicrobiia bacterium]|nr:shikimate kinase [Acidimicrobiia bacterium]